MPGELSPPPTQCLPSILRIAPWRSLQKLQQLRTLPWVKPLQPQVPDLIHRMSHTGQ